MKPHETKIWISTNDEQIRFLKFIRTQLRNDKYKEWVSVGLPSIDHRIRLINEVIKREGYYKNGAGHRVLKNIRKEYADYLAHTNI